MNKKEEEKLKEHQELFKKVLGNGWAEIDKIEKNNKTLEMIQYLMGQVDLELARLQESSDNPKQIDELRYNIAKWDLQTFIDNY